MLILYTITLFAVFLTPTEAQLGVLGGTPLFDNSTCVTGPNTTFTNCNTYYSTLANCTSNTTEAALADCQCRQTFFNLMVDCKSELRDCTGNSTWDATLDPQIESWHSVCDSTGIEPTSPILTATNGLPTAN
ncbi:hypothetical protein FKW77_009204 [Venturia effusa]|uniref:Extracellular membrane protein CFEM domain-containing protein n=1 Tax=Venturia effusa TaxID=50376 RepID=A0A517LCX6_9PEZI|nr:hypothetical protein FKW77_009204 [Venturia effusa]